MADKPIIFSGPMVRALLDGTKTQTRRVLKPQPEFRGGCGDYHDAEEWGWEDECGAPVSVIDICPNGMRKGDRLWVREAVTWVSAWGWRYRADNDDLAEKREAGEVGKWKPSIHMPRHASRLTLTVTDVRVQRLQQISEADAVAEGVSKTDGITDAHNHWVDMGGGDLITGWDAREVFAGLWNHINGGVAWAANPWVAAYTFTVHRGNIDQMPGVADG